MRNTALLALNSQNLPYPDPLHPIVVHFVVAMVLFAFACDVVGYFTHRQQLFEVSFWNWVVASLAVFVAVMVGQLEAGLAQPYEVAQSTLNLHTLTGWVLSAAVVAITAWRFVIRRRNPLKLPVAYLGVATALGLLVVFQTYLGTRLVWVYGLHVEPVVEAMQRSAP
ncbi:DUF2231 domain-containing protein [Nodosilinea nodulosa]|uniref:DUF2231 domain-containing protein n=1 Tax=Nodosilinea nodulosa TaxID=416001 RepID=UPI00031B6EF2|nr:DUF2231 domain-containing protein [Nodosilinea nodulosa]